MLDKTKVSKEDYENRRTIWCPSDFGLKDKCKDNYDRAEESIEQGCKQCWELAENPTTLDK